MKTKSRIAPVRELLLIEIERRCPACGERVTLGLTKEEARMYHEFQCERCETKTDDNLTERDVSEWWDELMIRALDAGERDRRTSDAGEPVASVLRLNQAARHAEEGFTRPEENFTDAGDGAKEIER